MQIRLVTYVPRYTNIFKGKLLLHLHLISEMLETQLKV